MKKILAVAGVFLLLASTAVGQGIRYVPLGYQKITSLSAAVNINAPANATMFVMAVEGAAIRYRDDGTAPTASAGMPVAAGQAFQYSGTLANVQVIEQSASASVSILYYR